MDEVNASTGMYQMLITFVLMFAIFYFLIIRPQQKKQKERNQMLLNLKKGDKVVTIGGIHGTIVELTDDTCVLLLNDSTKMTFDRSAINALRNPDRSEKEKK